MKLSRVIALCLGASLLGTSVVARAETDSETIKRLEAQVQALIDAQQRLKEQQAQSEKALIELRERVRAATEGRPAPPLPTAPPRAAVSGDLSARFDATDVRTRDTGAVPEGTEGTFRQRVRLNFNTPISHRSEAGLQITTGLGQSPTVPYVVMGDAFRGKEFRLGRAYYTLHFGDPTDSREPVLHIGKMPNPFWRAEAGPAYGYASEIVWDNDVSPEGIAVRVPLTGKGSKIGVTNTLAGFLINWVAPRRFVGLTTDTWQLENQLKVDAGQFKGAISYLFFEHLNSGLHAPTFIPGFGVDPTPPTSAFLLRPPLQTTNGQYGYGPNAFGFGNDQFHIVNLTGQYLHKNGRGRGVHPFLVGEYVRNFSVPVERVGWGVTAGATKGGATPGGWTGWLTYRFVGADATLATFADSDLGGGTDYKGFQFGAVYRLRENLFGRLLYNDYAGSPRKDNKIRRLFVDLIRPF